MNKENKKISILIYSLAGGGAERMVSYLLPYLLNKKIEVHLVLMNNTISYKIPKEITIHHLENSKGDENGILKLIKLPLLAYKYATLLKQFDIKYSFSLLTRPSYINILSRLFNKSKFRLVISERSHPSMQYGYDNMQSSINNWLIKVLYPKTDKIICNSQGNADDLQFNYGIPHSLLEVVHNPIDIEKIQAISKLENFFDEEFFNIVTIGRMDVGKNHQLLLKAIVKNSSARLYILGSGVLEEMLKNLAHELKVSDRVFFLGFDSNPFQYLKGADLFAFGSNHEGFPNVLLEAMCCSLPIVSTNCPSGPSEILELKTVNENKIMITDYGVLTPVGDLERFEEAISYCIQHPEFLVSCRVHMMNRIKDFRREPILASYLQHIYQ